ncbi:MFS transporter [Leifsonia sp. F6_8S_P_1B]|uniref:MFS transporter n=1 Tax=Leifsonia williamsii TaxID=3035919 RepID=A0ABT8KDP6_9MICO|nr:MFS transporter [Leifsonia williamsii]MDN4615088.1 MFS transporter [Leifsonia williamsii]
MPSQTAATPKPRSRVHLGGRYWTLWSSSALSNLADGVLKVALPLVAIRFTDSPALIAGLGIAFTLPWLLTALTAGALADRFDRRRLMLIANIARSAVLGGLLVLTLLGGGSIWVLYGAAFLVGVAETVYDTSAQSILPQLVGRDALSRANGRLYAAELTANQFVGPPLGGLLVALSAALAIGAPAAFWVAAVVMLLFVRGRYATDHPRTTTIRADIAEGLRFLGRHRLLRVLAVMVGGFNFAINAVFTVFVLYAVGAGSALQLNDPEYGLLLTVMAIGSVLGTFLAEPCERVLGRARSLIVTVFAVAIMLAVPAFTTNLWAIGALFALGGAAISVWNVITVSLRQRVTPPRLLGRVNSAYRLLAFGTMPLGSAVGGLIAEILGLPAVFLIAGLVTLSLLSGMFWVTDGAMSRAEEDADRVSGAPGGTPDGSTATAADER